MHPHTLETVRSLGVFYGTESINLSLEPLAHRSLTAD